MSALDWIREAEGDSPADATRRGFAGAILAVFGGIIMVVESAFEGISEIMDVFGAARDFFVTMLTAPSTIITGTAQETLYSLTRGEWAFFGPFTFTVGIVSIALAWMAWSRLDPEVPIVDDLLPWR